MPRTAADLTGQRFGKLVVDGFAGYGESGRQKVSLWNCRCDCGNTCTAAGYLLKNGRRKSCGCIRFTAKELVGKRYGMLTVLREDPDNRTTLQKVICRCDCGREKSVATRDLKNGKAVSCGCDRLRLRKRTDFRERQYDERMERKREAFGKGDFSEIIVLSDWVYIWLRDVLPNVVKETTIRMYAETMDHHILPSLGTLPLEELTEQAVQKWIGHLQEASIPGTQSGRMTEGTVRNTLSVLSGCMRDAQKYGLIDRNPCLENAWTLKSRNVWEQQSWLDEEQIRVLEPLLAAYQDEDGYPIGLGFQLVLYTGITLSEAAALRWRNVDIPGQRLKVEDFVAVKREGGENGEERRYELEPLTGRKRREVPVPGVLLRRLKELSGEYGGRPEDFVLSRSDQEPIRMDRMRAALMRRANSCGMGPVTLRMLRDTYAVRAVQSGATSDTIAELMGFASSQQVIRRYMPRSVTDKQELVRRMFGE
ncbi:MAG: tyrosine-type recombinase/integrase family protein [Clostridiales bacterium]|nr:tyrosine-type recombinase/integrase family protein [Clostridiales bacterium]